jgi:hypothetical protein
LLIDLKFERFASKYHSGLLVRHLNFMPKQLTVSGSWLAEKMSMRFYALATSGMEPLLYSPRVMQGKRCIRQFLSRLVGAN